MNFERYANFYDWLYRDKDYREECNFVKRIFEAYGEKEIRTILDLGCGTGSHALVFAEMGYTVTGVDLSEKMLRLAGNKSTAQNKQINFLQGDIRCLDLQRRFDAVIAMFNVLGYQTTNQDVVNTIRSARNHLNSGGLFVCDIWFGPAVLNDKPAERVKSIEKEDSKIIRYAHPILDILDQTIEVNYTVSEIREGHRVAEVKEPHLVRFFFYQELLNFLERNGFEVLRICPFMDSDGQVDEHCWNISVIGKGI
ncbi:class I SAM-dependent DNA methyltransferase [Chloroflexota bacterium]